MVSVASNDDVRPVWFVTGGPPWRGYIGSGYWTHYDTHEDAAPSDDIIREMRPGDRIAIKSNRFYHHGKIGIWATGVIWKNNLPNKSSVEVRWNSYPSGRQPLWDCEIDGLNVSEDDCVWRIGGESDAEKTFITIAFDGPLPAPNPDDPSPEPTSVDGIISDGCFLERQQLETMLQRLAVKRNIILQGPPGTGKTWLAKRLAYALVGRRDNNTVRPLQFHPSMSYEDFVRGWRPAGDGRLELVDGPFLRLIADANQNPDGRYVMVIEEINRGSPAQIFGEMLTLLEADKRHPDEALALAYPRSDHDRVYIPPNVYVIGTMNLADRSLALVDFALRRRFAFFDLEPTLGRVWRNWVSDTTGIPDAFLADVERRLTALNDQIAADRSLGRQFRIGHSFVTPQPGVTIDNPQEWFSHVVATEIAPQLDEYWFDNPETADAAKSELLDGM